jgi:predicted glycogen debranching enzyme
MTRRLIDSIVRELPVPSGGSERAAYLADREWLVTNGMGGYASSTLTCTNTRRYHGLLVAALPNPFGRMVMLGHVDELIAGATAAPEIVRFRLEAGLPVWDLQADGVHIEKRIWMPHGQNTVFVIWTLIEGNGTAIELRPGMHFRGYEEAVDVGNAGPYHVEDANGLQQVTTASQLPPLLMGVLSESAAFKGDPIVRQELQFPVEEARGFVNRGRSWSPGCYTVELRKDAPVAFVATMEREDVVTAMTADESRACEHERRRRLIRSADVAVQSEVGGELVVAADQFVITPAGRLRDATRARSLGDEIRTIIAGYHWFTDWGRDTMISLEGLTLVSGRYREAAWILRTFAHYVHDGLIPNLFPDGSNQGLYHTADATLWFFHALQRYYDVTADDDLLLELLPTMQTIVSAHLAGTRFGIGVDPEDGLIRQGAEGYQLTWMDAKVDGWVVTPRRGKAVEINALWYNALCNLAGWTEQIRGKGEGSDYLDHAQRARESFNRKFWNPERGFLFDVIEGEQGNSPLCRPNQVFAISLENPVLDRSRWETVMDVVTERLLTPYGLRSLAPGEPEYKPRYFGDLRARDAAYHQGTVWGWLIGPYVDAWLKLHPEGRETARGLLDGLIAHLNDFGVGSVAEIFDATEPFTARGCIAQAWSVAEVLRCYALTASPRS